MKIPTCLYFMLGLVISEPCFAPKELNLFALGASCGGTPSLLGRESHYSAKSFTSTLFDF